MTYQEHLLYSWGGSLANGKEIWSNSLRITGTNGPVIATESFLFDALDSYIADTKALVLNAAAGMNGAVTFEWAKLNPINEFGRYESATRTIGRNIPPGEQPSGGAGGVNATFLTCAVSLKTDVQRGPGSAGRFFIPGVAWPVSFDGVFSTAQCQAASAVYAQFIANLANFPGPDLQSLAPHVVSNVGAPGPAEEIKYVQIGNVPDVMRSRKNNLQELRYTTTVPSA
jgi:hypothetical protein